MHDGAGLQIQTGAQTGAVIKRNWVHDSPKFGIRFDGSTHFGTGSDLAENVVWNAHGFMCKGDNHTVAANLALENVSGNECSLCVIYRLRNDPTIMNMNSLVANNAATLADG